MLHSIASCDGLPSARSTLRGERHLAKTQPARLQSMKAKLASLQAGAFSPSRGEPQMEAACSAAQSTCPGAKWKWSTVQHSQHLHFAMRTSHFSQSHLLCAFIEPPFAAQAESDLPDIDRIVYDEKMAKAFGDYLDVCQPDMIHFHCIQRLTAAIVLEALLRRLEHVERGELVAARQLLVPLLELLFREKWSKVRNSLRATLRRPRLLCPYQVARNANMGKLQAGYLFPEIGRRLGWHSLPIHHSKMIK